jgi:hypothetical protein
VNDLAGNLAGLLGFVFLDLKSLKGGSARGVKRAHRRMKIMPAENYCPLKDII